MKKYLFVIIICSVSLKLFSQAGMYDEIEKRNCITLGILQGGGSLLGADFEALLTDQFGIQIGAGLVGFGGGLNYHFQPSIRSSFLSLQYWNQGIGETFTQSAFGPNYVFRGKKWFTFQIGLGLPLEKGPAWRENIVQPPVMLLYSIGAYIPL